MAQLASLVLPNIAIPQRDFSWIGSIADSVGGAVDEFGQRRSYGKLADLIGEQPQAATQQPSGGFLSSLAPQTTQPSQTSAAPVTPVQRGKAQGSTYQPFINTVRAGGLTNPNALAAVAAYGDAESGWSPKNAVSTWSDPSQSGQPGTSGGILSWRGDRYARLAAGGDLSPEAQARYFLQEDPQLIAALNQAKSPEEASRLMANAWKFAGYDKPGGEGARRAALARNYYANDFANEQPTSAAAAIEAQAPGGMGSPLTDQAFDDRFGPSPLPVDQIQGKEALAGRLAETNGQGGGLRPFQPGERRNNADGSYSTEITTTWQLPSGEWVNVPSLWMGPNGPKQFNPDDEQGILGAMAGYEQQNGPAFQRYKTAQEAEQAARSRSNAGGAGAGQQVQPAAYAPNQVADASGSFMGVPGVQPIPRGGVNPEIIQFMLRDPNLREAGLKLWAQNATGKTGDDWQFIQSANGDLLRANQQTGAIERVGNFGKNQEQFRILTPDERSQFGIPPEDRRVYQVGPNGQISAVGGAGQTINVGNEVEARRQAAAQAGLTPEDPAYQGFILTGKLPRENEQTLTATDKKAILEADEAVMNAEGVLPLLGRALELNDQAYSGPLAGTRGMITGTLGSDAGEATLELDNVVTGQALGQLKAIFGGAPTEGERKILLDMSGSSSLPPAVRKGIYQRAMQAVERRLQTYRDRANELRGGTFYKPGSRSNKGNRTSSGVTWEIVE